MNDTKKQRFKYFHYNVASNLSGFVGLEKENGSSLYELKRSIRWNTVFLKKVSLMQNKDWMTICWSVWRFVDVLREKRVVTVRRHTVKHCFWKKVCFTLIRKKNTEWQFAEYIFTLFLNDTSRVAAVNSQLKASGFAFVLISFHLIIIFLSKWNQTLHNFAQTLIDVVSSLSMKVKNSVFLFNWDNVCTHWMIHGN